ncbi:MAG: phage portal protein [Alphaproteobacteria bacterium]|nr:phage portal protein [Alphaproteobacteria bacterium]
MAEKETRLPFWKGAIGRLWRKPTAAPPETKASRAGPLIACHATGRPIWTPRDYASLAREGMARNPIAYRCIRMIAEAAASVPFIVYVGASEAPGHPLETLLRAPNPVAGGATLLEAWYGYLQTAGNAYLEAVTLEGAPRELYVLRPDRMRIVPGPRGWPDAYEYEAGGQSVRFERDGATGFMPVLHVALFNPLSDYYGQSPLEAAAFAIDIHNAGGAWNKALLDNAARPSGALIYGGGNGEGQLSSDQFARLKEELAEHYQGPRNAGRPLLLEGGLDWKPMSLSPAEMDFIEAKHVAAREIALAFGVPPQLLGIPGDATYANYREANLAFWRHTVLPVAAKTAEAIGNFLGPLYGPGVRLGLDLDGIEALSLERESLWQRVNGASFLTLDEKRAAVGYGRLPQGARVHD